MARIARLPNINATVARKLTEKKIKTVDQLWLCIGNKLDKGIETFRGQEFTRAEVTEILVQGACVPVPTSNQYRHRFAFWVRNHGKEVISLIVLIFLFGVLLVRATRKQDTIVVNTANALPGLHVVQNSEIAVKPMFRIAGSLTSTNEVVGRYLRNSVSPGAVLLDKQLGPTELKNQIQGRAIITMPIRGNAIGVAADPPQRIRLLFSPRNRDEAAKIGPTLPPDLILEDVIVLAVNRQGESNSITVALKSDDDLAKAIKLLATSDLLISEKR